MKIASKILLSLNIPLYLLSMPLKAMEGGEDGGSAFTSVKSNSSDSDGDREGETSGLITFTGAPAKFIETEMSNVALTNAPPTGSGSGASAAAKPPYVTPAAVEAQKPAKQAMNNDGQNDPYSSLSPAEVLKELTKTAVSAAASAENVFEPRDHTVQLNGSVIPLKDPQAALKAPAAAMAGGAAAPAKANAAQKPVRVLSGGNKQGAASGAAMAPSPMAKAAPKPPAAAMAGGSASGAAAAAAAAPAKGGKPPRQASGGAGPGSGSSTASSDFWAKAAQVAGQKKDAAGAPPQYDLVDSVVNLLPKQENDPHFREGHEHYVALKQMRAGVSDRKVLMGDIMRAKAKFDQSSSPRAKFFHGLMYVQGLGSLIHTPEGEQKGWQFIAESLQKIQEIERLKQALEFLETRFKDDKMIFFKNWIIGQKEIYKAKAAAAATNTVAAKKG